MSEKWTVMIAIWIISGVVAIFTDDSGVMVFPALGTLLAAIF
jgi:hypothetical protein